MFEYIDRLLNRAPWLRFVWVIVLMFSVAACLPNFRPKEFNNTDISNVDYAKDFSLVDMAGNHRSLADFRGKVVIVIFGYTHCQDVCSAALAEIKAAVAGLKDQERSHVQVLFVTLDPLRDKPPKLKSYVSAFDVDFLGLTGSPEEINRVAQSFRVIYQIVPGVDKSNYVIEYTTGSYVFDPLGRVRLFVRNGRGATGITADLSSLLAEPL